MKFRTLHWQAAADGEPAALVLLDQTRLPGEVVDLVCTDVEMVAEAIELLRVRSASPSARAPRRPPVAA